jgi:hypothetical protein
MALKCPSCNVAFHPQFTQQFLGFKKGSIPVYVCYQLCPSCDEPIMGYKAGAYTSVLDATGLTLMMKQK